MLESLRVARISIIARSRGFISDFTGKLSKSIVMLTAPELEDLFKPDKQRFKLVHITPPIDIVTGQALFPCVRGSAIVPVRLQGRYVIVFAADKKSVDKLCSGFLETGPKMQKLDFRGVEVEFFIEGIEVSEPEIPSIDVLPGSVIYIRFVSPALLPDPFKPRQRVRRFFPTPGILFFVPAMIAAGFEKLNSRDQALREQVLRYVALLEEVLFELHTSLPRLRVVKIVYEGRVEPALIGEIGFAVNPDVEREKLEFLARVLATAQCLGVGAARASGFGHIEIDISRAAR